MKKSIKISLLSFMILGGSIFAYAKTQEVPEWFCQGGSTGICLFDPLENSPDCLIPPTPMTNGDCSGMYNKPLPVE